ncbi:uncharacterized protein G6M90_00g031180 [Metarhizium brunneum]|uniref:NmrA-like domain-containing protein n=1 Tax=Metarhizium brunneum TaxID=500148 RepID=A0A7D5YQD2_9HYPO
MSQEYAKNQPKGFSNHIERVAIVGAGGRLGGFIIKELCKTGKHTVTAITRATSTTKLPDSVQAALVDYDDEDSLVKALHGQQFLIITLAFDAPGDTQPKLIRAAAKAGVPYVMPNWFAFDFANEQLMKDTPVPPEVEGVSSLIESLGVSSWVVLTTGLWYEYVLYSDNYGIDIRNRSVLWIDDARVRYSSSTWPQMAKAITALVSLKEFPDDENDKLPTLSQLRNNVVYIASFSPTQKEVFNSVKKATGTSDKDWTFTSKTSKDHYEEGAAKTQKGDLSGFGTQIFGRLSFPTGEGDYESRRGLHNKTLGLSIEDIDAYTGIVVEAISSNQGLYAGTVVAPVSSHKALSAQGRDI